MGVVLSCYVGVMCYTAIDNLHPWFGQWDLGLWAGTVIEPDFGGPQRVWVYFFCERDVNPVGQRADSFTSSQSPKWHSVILAPGMHSLVQSPPTPRRVHLWEQKDVWKVVVCDFWGYIIKNVSFYLNLLWIILCEAVPRAWEYLTRPV